MRDIRRLTLSPAFGFSIALPAVGKIAAGPPIPVTRDRSPVPAPKRLPVPDAGQVRDDPAPCAGGALLRAYRSASRGAMGRLRKTRHPRHPSPDWASAQHLLWPLSSRPRANGVSVPPP